MTYQGFAAVDNARVYGVVSKSQILCSIASCSLSLHNTIMMITDLSTCQKRVIWEAASRSLVSSRKEFALNEILGFGLTYVPNNTCWASRPFRHWHALVSFSLTLSNPALMISLISVAPAQSPSNLRERRRVGLLWTSFCIAAMVVWPKKLLCQSWRQAPAPILRWGQIPRNTSIYGVATDGPSVPITHQADQTFWGHTWWIAHWVEMLGVHFGDGDVYNTKFDVRQDWVAKRGKRWVGWWSASDHSHLHPDDEGDLA